VIGATLKEHVRNLREVFPLLRKTRLRLNRDKCQFFQPSLKYLGHVISGAGIQTDPYKVAAIRELTPPTNLRELRRCLGIASWYRCFVRNFADVIEPMTNLLKTEEQEQAFQRLMDLLTEAKFVLQIDASEYGIGAVRSPLAKVADFYRQPHWHDRSVGIGAATFPVRHKLPTRNSEPGR